MRIFGILPKKRKTKNKYAHFWYLPKNTPKNTKNAHFWHLFSGYLGGILLGFQNFGPGVFLRYFSWKFRVGPSWGSVAGQVVLNCQACYVQACSAACSQKWSEGHGGVIE